MTPTPDARPLDDVGGRAASADLEARIAEMEGRIVARQRHLIAQTQAVEERVQQALQPRRVLPPLVAVALGAAALWSVTRHRGADRHSAPRPLGTPRTFSPATGRWSRLVEIGRPIVGARLGLGANPTLATVLLSAGLPLLRRLFDLRTSRHTTSR
jgi:hypothetical protein